jgi:hypothetical protein
MKGNHMLYNAAAIKGFSLEGYDGEIGKVVEFYFDDRHWTIRYLVADTGDWLVDRKVLLSPYALVDVSCEKRCISVNLTKKQIEESPPLSSNKPVSRQFEEAYYGYYSWPVYWAGPYMWGAYPYIAREDLTPPEKKSDEKAWDPHLRSTHDVIGYHIEASDGEIGHVEDFVIDDETWAIRYLVIATHNWWPGKHVLVAMEWLQRVNWDDSKVIVNLPRKIIKESPCYTGDFTITREYEAELHRHYNRQGYWVD